jgi:hypothetical protein
MKIITKFAFVLLVGVFVVFGGSTSAKADSDYATCMDACSAAVGTCTANCTADYSWSSSKLQACTSQCQAALYSCQAGCSN